MEITIDGTRYRTGKLDAFMQLHVARRVTPLIMAIGKTGAQMLNASEDDFTFGAVASVAQALRDMPQQDVNFVLAACLSVCEREEQGGKWQRVIAPLPAGWEFSDHVRPQLVYQDIEMPAMMRLTTTTIQENLGRFMPGLLGLGA